MDNAIASVHPSRYLLLNHWTKSNQIGDVSCSHEWGLQRHNFFSSTRWGSWEGLKVQISLFSITKSILMIFKPNFVCLLTNERYKTYIRDFYSVSWVMPQGLELVGAGGQKFNFLNMVMWHIKLKGMRGRPGHTENFTLVSNW